MKSFVRLVAILACAVTAFQIAVAEPESRTRYDYDSQTHEKVYDQREQRSEHSDGHTLPKIADKIGRGLRRIGGTLEHFFTGKRTIDSGER
jgi:hypothetical protein